MHHALDPRFAGWFGMSHHGHPGGRGRHRRGGMPFGGPGFGFGGPGRHRGRAQRGDVRAALLALLAEEPRNGYQLMQEIERRSEGVWRPSPGSVYPALQQLEDEGLVRAEESDGRKLFHLTDSGRAAASERAESAEAPWDSVGDSVDSDALELMGMMRQVGMAAGQLAQIGTEKQLEAARTVLADARRALYGILAEDAPEPDDTA
jgi:DNA-binding PadR family transcriptional regulator